MKTAFTHLLVCPECGGELELRSHQYSSGGEVRAGSLNCPAGHLFEIRDGIPRFVETNLYASNFAYEWTLHSDTQLDTGGRIESEAAFVAKTGWGREDLEGKLVLDVGCGMGRFSDVASRWGATVVGVDLTVAVDSAQLNIGARRNVHLAQADVLRLPFAPNQFDCIFSIGVLHHTPSTRAAFDRLPRLLKPGGRIAVWVYSTSMRRWCWTSDIYRLVTTRLPERLLYRAAHVANPLYQLRRRLERRSSVLSKLVGVALPVSMHSDPVWRVLDTFDWYSPRYQHKHSPIEVTSWFHAHGLDDIRVLPFVTAVSGRRPAPADNKRSVYSSGVGQAPAPERG